MSVETNGGRLLTAEQGGHLVRLFERRAALEREIAAVVLGLNAATAAYAGRALETCKVVPVADGLMALQWPVIRPAPAKARPDVARALDATEGAAPDDFDPFDHTNGAGG
jgi:hypothetical protein